jgi:hypothetical protein
MRAPFHRYLQVLFFLENIYTKHPGAKQCIPRRKFLDANTHFEHRAHCNSCGEGTESMEHIPMQQPDTEKSMAGQTWHLAQANDRDYPRLWCHLPPTNASRSTRAQCETKCNNQRSNAPPKNSDIRVSSSYVDITLRTNHYRPNTHRRKCRQKMDAQQTDACN